MLHFLAQLLYIFLVFKFITYTSYKGKTCTWVFFFFIKILYGRILFEDFFQKQLQIVFSIAFSTASSHSSTMYETLKLF